MFFYLQIYTSIFSSSVSCWASAIGGFSQPLSSLRLISLPISFIATLCWNPPSFHTMWWVTTQFPEPNNSFALTTAM